jgi:hypothetical protein
MRSGAVRWSKSETGVMHAYAYNWREELPSEAVPACGRDVPRRKLGRPGAPALDATVCDRCAAAVGFHRRPLTSRAWAIKRAAQAPGKAPALATILSELRELRGVVDGLAEAFRRRMGAPGVAAGKIVYAEPGTGCVTLGAGEVTP